MESFFSKKNYLGVLIALVLAVIGFFLLGRGPADNGIAMNVAPFILVLAYVVVLPIAIIRGKGKEEKK